MRVKQKEKAAIMQALQAGVVPKKGLSHIQVGRNEEMTAMIKDIDRVVDGGSAFRLINGEYGSGKTFFLHVIKQIALKKKVVCAVADLSPERKLVSSKGQARLLYSELISGLSTATRPEGGALNSILDVFTNAVITESEETGVSYNQIISTKLSPLNSFVGGFDLQKVLQIYCESHIEGNDVKAANALRWLRGEYTTKTDAKNDLGVRTYIDDGMFYDALKLISRFVQIAGYAGMFVLLDEGVNLMKIGTAASRKNNYEMVLRILNDTLQGDAEYFGFIMGTTPETVYNQGKGFCSYDALATRLEGNQFAKKSGLIDYSQPVISLENLSQEELFILLGNIRKVVAADMENETDLITDDGIKSFMSHCFEKMGANYFQTPRKSIRAFVNLLSLLEQYTDKNWTDFIEEIELDASNDSDAGNSELQEFTL